MIDIRKRVKELCNEQGISESKLAEQIGMRQRTLNDTLKRGNPKISVVVDMATIFGLTLSEFMQDERHREPAFTFSLPDGTKVGLFPTVMV
jgi:transcriptional regulator with XRE-family HTH domain